MLTFNSNRAADTLPRECVGAESMLSLATPTPARIASLHHHHRRHHQQQQHHHQQHLSYAAAFLGHAHFLPPPPPPSWFLSPPSSSSSPAPSDGQAPGWKTTPPPDDEDLPSAPDCTEVDLMNGGGQQGPLPARSGQVGHNAPPPADICSPYNGGESLRWLADVAAHHRTPVSGTPPTSNQELYPIRPRMYAPPPLYVGLPPFYANPALPSTASYSAFYSPATMLHPARGGAFTGLSPPTHAMGRGVCTPPSSSNPPHQLVPPLSFGDESPGGFRRFPPPPSPTSPAFNAPPPPPQPSTPPRKGGAIEGKEGSLKHRFLSSRTSSTGGNKSGLEDIKEEERGAAALPPVSTPMRRRRGVAKRLMPESRGRLLYPAHFTRGSMIQLATGELKRVEDMRTDDFVASADASHHLKIDSSTLVRVDCRSITDDEDDDADVGGGRQVALLGFSVGERRVQVTVEAALEHPFFVFGQGWSSCCPERTKTRYGLTCSKLQVGDVCVSLTHKTRPSTGDTATPPPSSSDVTPPDSCSRKRRWSAPAAEAESDEQIPPFAPPHRSSS